MVKIFFLYFVKNAWKAKLDFWKPLWISHNFTCNDDNVRNADDDAYDRKYKETSVYIMEKNTDLRLMEMEINDFVDELIKHILSDKLHATQKLKRMHVQRQGTAQWTIQRAGLDPMHF